MVQWNQATFIPIAQAVEVHVQLKAFAWPGHSAGWTDIRVSFPGLSSSHRRSSQLVEGTHSADYVGLMVTEKV